MKTIDLRRSVRKFKESPVSNEKIDALLRAAMQAPSAGNQQPWEFVVVKNKDQIEVLSKVSPFAGFIASAPVVIVLLCNNTRLKKPHMWQQDMAAATQNLLLEAVEQGLGAVWIGVAPLEDRITHVEKVMTVGVDCVPFSMIALGEPEGAEANHFIDRFDASRVTFLE